jgi:hypothetical protein
LNNQSWHLKYSSPQHIKLNVGIGTIFYQTIVIQNVKTMEKKKKKTGPKDKKYVNQSEPYEVKYEPKRKTPAKKFGSKSKGK